MEKKSRTSFYFGNWVYQIRAGIAVIKISLVRKVCAYNACFLYFWKNLLFCVFLEPFSASQSLDLLLYFKWRLQVIDYGHQCIAKVRQYKDPQSWLHIQLSWECYHDGYRVEKDLPKRAQVRLFHTCTSCEEQKNLKKQFQRTEHL